MSIPIDPSCEHEALVALIGAIQARGYHFVTPTPATHKRVNLRPGNEWAHNLRDVLGWSRPFLSHIIPRSLFELMKQANVLEVYKEGFRCRIRISSTHDGLLYAHSAYPTDSSDAVFFGPDSYRYINAINDLLTRRPAVRRAFDIGCGAGPGALTIARSSPEAEVWACDINPSAIEMTRVNLAAAHLSNVICCTGDFSSCAAGKFDLITANPPYLIDAEQRAYRHGGGQFGEQLALNMLQEAMSHLTLDGTFLLYTGTAIVEGQDIFKDKATTLLEAQGAAITWRYREIDPDVFGEELEQPAYRGVERIAVIVLEVTRAASSPNNAE